MSAWYPDGKPRKPARVSDVLASVLQQAGLTERLAQTRVIPEWPMHVGPQIAAISEPLNVQADGTLVVAVKTHAWMQELSMLEPELLKRLNGDTSRPAINRIRWVLQRN